MLWTDYSFSSLSGSEALILDFTHVEFLGTEFLNTLIKLRKKLALAGHRGFGGRRNLYEIFQVFPDRQTAIDAISDSESDSLILCCLPRHLREMLYVI